MIKQIINYINKYKKADILILLLILFMLLIIFGTMFEKKKEGFGINDVNKVFDQIDDVTKLAEKLPKQINSIDDKLMGKVNELGDKVNKNMQQIGKDIEKNTVDKIEKMGKEIEKNTVDLFTNKLKSIFTQLGDIFNKGLVEPIIALFTGIGNIFVQIFGILEEIGNKIVQLPSCIFTYAIKSFFDSIDYLYSRIMPKFIRNPLSTIYSYTLGILVNFIAEITGYNDSVRKCYGFNVNSEVNKINSNLTDINKSFKKDFGNLNFSKIKI
jgi:hypothetical protein